MDKSATNTTVLITRAHDDALGFADLLSKKQLNSFIFPCIEFQAPPDNYKELDSCIRKNHEYNWVIFLSKKSAEVFFDRLLAIGGNLFNLAPKLRIACIGSSTKELVEKEIGFPVDFCPSEFNSDVFIKEFQRMAKAAPEYNFKILLPRTTIADQSFINELEDTEGVNIEIDLVPAYTSQCPSKESLVVLDGITKIKELALKKLIVSFTSSQIVRNFQTLIPELNLDSPNFKVISIGPKTTQTIKEVYGSKLKVIEPPEATINALSELLTQL